MLRAEYHPNIHNQNGTTMSTSPSSLRDLYHTPSNTWSFVPSTPNNSSSSAASSTPSSSYQWSTRSNPNPLFDLSASFSQDDTGADVRVILQSLLASALLQYAATALSIPWDVGKTLLQVQWVPRDAGDVAPGAVLTTDEFEEEEVRTSLFIFVYFLSDFMCICWFR